MIFGLRRFIALPKIEGFKVIGTATTGEQAKEWLELVKPQLVLLDVYLPDMRGTELVTYIRHNLHNTDIIMITVVRNRCRTSCFTRRSNRLYRKATYV